MGWNGARLRESRPSYSVKSHPMRIAILQRDPVMRQSIEQVPESAGHTCMTLRRRPEPCRKRSPVPPWICWCWTGRARACPAPKCCGRCARWAAIACRSCSRRRTRRRRASCARSSAARTTTSRCRCAPPSFASASRRCCGGRIRTGSAPRVSMSVRTISTRTASSSCCAASRCSCPARSTGWRRCSSPTLAA